MADKSVDNSQVSKKKSKDKKVKEVGKIKPGDYTVHFLIQKAKEINIEEGETKDIFVQIEIGSAKEISSTKNEVTNVTVCNFDSHIFVELKGQSV